MASLARLPHLRLKGLRRLVLAVAALSTYFEAIDLAVVRSCFMIAMRDEEDDDESLDELRKRIDERFEGSVNMEYNNTLICIRYGEFYDDFDAVRFNNCAEELKLP